MNVWMIRQEPLAPVAFLMPVRARLLETLDFPRLTIDSHLGPRGYIGPRRASDPALPHGDADRVRLAAVGVVAVLVRDHLARLRALFVGTDLDARCYDGTVAR